MAEALARAYFYSKEYSLWCNGKNPGNSIKASEPEFVLVSCLTLGLYETGLCIWKMPVFFFVKQCNTTLHPTFSSNEIVNRNLIGAEFKAELGYLLSFLFTPRAVPEPSLQNPRTQKTVWKWLDYLSGSWALLPEILFQKHWKEHLGIWVLNVPSPTKWFWCMPWWFSHFWESQLV